MTSTLHRRLAPLSGCLAALLSLFSCTDAGTTASSLSLDETFGRGTQQTSFAVAGTGGLFHVRGPRGGPFPSGTRTYTLENTGPEALEWDLESTVPWLIPSPAGGILARGAQAQVTVAMDNTKAELLPVGDYPADLIFTDSDNDTNVHLAFLLSVLDLSVMGELDVSPSDGLSLQMTEGQSSGLPQSQFTVTNVGDGPLQWGATSSEPWLQLASTSGNVLIGQSDDVGVVLDPSMVSQLAPGLHLASVVILNTNIVAESFELEVALSISPAGGSGRVTNGLAAEYRFEEAGGTVVHDVSGLQPALDLSIENTSAVSWGAGTLSIQSPTVLTTGGPATRLTEAVRASGEVTVEAWIVPDSLNQEGPARLVTLSNGATMRNFTLGQGLYNGLPKDSFNMRCRHTSTDLDGEPMVNTGAGGAKQGLQHVVYTRTPGGDARIYVDGSVKANTNLAGNFSNWDSGYRFALANELGANRPWLGSFHLVAVYERALSSQEVLQNYQAGSGATNDGHLAVTPGGEVLFNAEEGVTPPTTSRNLELANIGGEPIEWTMTETAQWLSLTSEQGNLAPGASQTVAVRLEVAQVMNLAPGIYTTTVSFTNTTSGFGNTTRDVRLVVVEEGDSGAGGQKPGPSTTGPTDPGNLTTVGSMTVTQAGAVIENVLIQGTVSIKAPNVTMRNFIVDGGGNFPYGVRATDGFSGLTMEDGEIRNITSSGIYGGDFVARRLNLHESGGDAIKSTQNVLVERCWIHNLGTNVGAHADGNQTRYGSNFVFRQNNFDMPVDVGPPYKSNATFIVQTGAGPVDNFLIEENWLNGGNFTVYFTDKGVGYGDPTNCRLINNFFGREFEFGTLLTTGYVQVSGNRWEDTLELMDINNN